MGKTTKARMYTAVAVRSRIRLLFFFFFFFLLFLIDPRATYFLKTLTGFPPGQLSERWMDSLYAPRSSR
jgi:hypothetical protein